ncbi:hypothetical protein GDO81_014990 [Engystomops pustulosus]|uniref:Uncharacterized protein n=1 Tax=Engystomops pustulosus TaxID=76066 RepID=A0AAV7ALW6_ENGPU|nr:hypothetical protein GDO81_014990 [Engystomops pustulosus]
MRHQPDHHYTRLFPSQTASGTNYRKFPHRYRWRDTQTSWLWIQCIFAANCLQVERRLNDGSSFHDSAVFLAKQQTCDIPPTPDQT